MAYASEESFARAYRSKTQYVVNKKINNVNDTVYDNNRDYTGDAVCRRSETPLQCFETVQTSISSFQFECGSPKNKKMFSFNRLSNLILPTQLMLLWYHSTSKLFISKRTYSLWSPPFTTIEWRLLSVGFRVRHHSCDKSNDTWVYEGN